ncbi:MAG TPA: alpha-E domain-containing protein [Candidatus Sulfotelmatobacter sp.]|nr:alpha-E domain-containing protein [Candidatus Sulfotelmatobacter sp.]
MLSRVLDSLYWMSRYFERADNASRVLKATYGLILNPAKFSTEERWFRAVSSLAPGAAPSRVDPQRALFLLVADPEGEFSIVKCISGARENARQVREEISSEMWEHLNTLFHDVTGFELQPDDDAGAMRVVSLVREGSYRFNGITAGTLNHDEAWHFIQLGKYMERACNLCVLLDAYFLVDKHADDLDWVGLLSSCAAFEGYCKACTAELKPERIANFLLLKPEFPYSVRYSLDRMYEALNAISDLSLSHRTERVERLIGRLRSMVAYVQVDEIIAGLNKYLAAIIEQCRELHSAVHELYIEYPIEVAFPN